MQKVLHIKADKCTGCLQWNGLFFENYGTCYRQNPHRVFDFHHTGRKCPIPAQCDEAWSACLPGEPLRWTSQLAPRWSTRPLVLAQGLHHCLPFGTINYVQETGKVQKCDLCGGEPACADARPRARSRSSTPTDGSSKMAQWADKLVINPPSHKEHASCHGWKNLRVNLTAGTVKVEPLNMEWACLHWLTRPYQVPG